MRVLVVPLAVVLVLSGCSGEQAQPKKPAGGPAALADAVLQKVRAAGTAHVEVSADGQQATGDLCTDTATPTVRLSFIGSKPLQVVVRDGATFVRTEGEEIEPGKPWAKLSRAGLAALGDAGKLYTGLLDVIDKALREVTIETGLASVRNGVFDGPPAGEQTGEQVGGVTARRYSGTGSDPLGGAKVSWSLWVGPDGLPVRHEVRNGASSSSVLYTGWGAPVTVTPPDPGLVASLLPPN
ncbi:MAG: hypothetical protein ABIS86_04895 [Streptosporangiaceae bacterium]